MVQFRKEGPKRGPATPLRERGGWARWGPWPPRPSPGRPHPPTSSSPLVPHGGAKEEGCPLPPIYGCHVVILIKAKNWRKSNKSHDTSYHLSTSLVPVAPRRAAHERDIFPAARRRSARIPPEELLPQPRWDRRDRESSSYTVRV